MNVTKIDSRTVKTYTLTIEDGEVREQPYSIGPRRYRVERIVVRKGDGNVSGVDFYGPVLKKDGTAGQNTAKETFFRQGQWPEWLHSIVGGLA